MPEASRLARREPVSGRPEDSGPRAPAACGSACRIRTPPTHCARRRGGGRATPFPAARACLPAPCAPVRPRRPPVGRKLRRGPPLATARGRAMRVFAHSAARLPFDAPPAREPDQCEAQAGIRCGAVTQAGIHRRMAGHAAGWRCARRGRSSVSAPRARALAAPLPLDAPPAREPDQCEARAVMDGLRAWPNPFSAEGAAPKPKKRGLRPLAGSPPADAAPAPNALSGLRTRRPVSWSRGRRRSRRTARPQAARPCPRSATASCAWTRRLSTGRPRRSWVPRRRELLRGNR